MERAEKEILTKAAQTYQTTYEIAEALESSQATIVRKLKKYRLKVSGKRIDEFELYLPLLEKWEVQFF
ncbi:hypothetical protein RCO48_34220 [Peribacillus frigoritolerans]|nr:hypothetical protein [Peribacillus frigoritolerans]